jgi:hypothetical protein
MALKDHTPFERIFGNTAELRAIEFLLSTPDLYFTINELSTYSDVSITKLSTTVIPKLLQYEIINVNNEEPYSYTINRDSNIVKLIFAIDNELISYLLTEEENNSIYEMLQESKNGKS